MLFNKLVKLYLEDNKEGMETSWGPDDEGVTVTIKDVIKHLRDNDVPVKSVKVSELKPLLIDQDYDEGNKDRVDSSNLKYPIIVIKSNGKYKSILDGNHRLYKAIKSKLKTIKIQVIDLDSKSTPSSYKKLFNYEIDPLYK
jgi:hypothetical protein